MKRTMLDAGPLVAYLSGRDRNHKWAVSQFAALRPPLVTCEPVLAEACFLVRQNSGRPADVLKLLQRGIFQIGLVVETDACLVRLSELHADCRVFTLDSDFNRYRRNGRQMIPLLAPW